MKYFSFKIRVLLTFILVLSAASMVYASRQWFSFQSGHIGPEPSDPSPQVTIDDQGKNGLWIEVVYKGAYIVPEEGTITYSPPPETVWNSGNQVTETVSFNNIRLPECEYGRVRDRGISWESNLYDYYSYSISLPPNYEIDTFDYDYYEMTGQIDYVPFTPSVAGAPDVLQGPPIMPRGSRAIMTYWGNEVKLWPEDPVGVSRSIVVNPVRFWCDRKADGTIERKLKYIQRFRCQISFTTKSLPDDKPLLQDLNISSNKRHLAAEDVKKLAVDARINPQLILDGAAEIAAEDCDTRYGKILVISDPLYTDAVNSLTEWMMKRGYQIHCSYNTAWTSSSVQDTIDHYYDNSSPNLESILLFGDTETVPSSQNDGNPSDIQYKAVGNHGELIPIARIPVFYEHYLNSTPDQCIEQANDIVNKIVSYQTLPPNNSAVYTDITAAVHFANEEAPYDFDAGGSFLDNYNAAQDIGELSGYTVNELYGINREMPGTQLYFDGGRQNPVPPSISFDINRYDVVNAINSGTGLVWYAGHGISSGWENRYQVFIDSDLPSLNNTQYQPVVFSLACLTGNLNWGSFAKRLLALPASGASGVFAASETVHGSMLVRTPPFIKQLYSEPSFAALPVGWIINGAKLSGASSNGTKLNDDHLYFHYFGDPTMRIWTQNPHSNPIIITSRDEFIVPNKSFNVSYSGIPDVYKKFATATLVASGKLIGVDNGEGRINVDCNGISAPDTAYLTITAPNCLPVLDVRIPIVEAVSDNYHPLSISRAVVDYAVYGKQSVAVGDWSNIYNNETMTAYANTSVSNTTNDDGTINIGSNVNVGTVESKGNVVLRNYCTVHGNVISNDTPEIHDGAQIMGRTIIDNNIQAMSMELVDTIPTGQMDLTIPAGNSWLLVADNYKDIIIESGATVTVQSGVYCASKLEVRDGATLIFDTAGGPVIFMIDGRINIYSRVTMAGDETEKILFISGYQSGSDWDYGVYIAPDVQWNGTIVSPYSQVQFNSNVGKGALLGKSVSVSPNTSFIHIPFAF